MKKSPEFLKQFVIQFSGLKIGQYEYSFKAEKQFFDYFDIEDINDGNIMVDLLFHRKETMLELELDISGTVVGVCDRCLDPITLPIFSEREVLVKFGNETNFENDELIILGQEQFQIDIAPIVYEMIVLSLPLQKAHDIADCDPELVKHLTSDISESKEQENETPSIWEELKKINKK